MEVLVSMAVIATSAAGLAELVVIASRATQASRIDTAATFAAESKLAELRALSFVWDAASAPLTDPALAISPSSSLSTDAPGFIDYVDATGQRVAEGLPGSRVYVRRWSIQPLPADPLNTLVLQVVAAPMTTPRSRTVHLVSILARTAS